MIDPDKVTLEERKNKVGSKDKYWHIYFDRKRAGFVEIKWISSPGIGEHPSINIHINQSQRGRGIGRVANRLACESSGYEEVYGEMRRSNIASRKAAEAAGFVEFKNLNSRQLFMVWRK